MKRKAFTMIELIIVIIIISIIASTMNMKQLSNIDDVDSEYNELYQTIKYLKLSNLNNNFFNSNNVNWVKKTDCFQLVNKNKYDLENNGILLLSRNNDGKKFEKTTKNDIVIKDESNNNISKICFDNLGRSYKTDLTNKNIMHEKINIIIKNKTNDYNRTITISPITGYIE